MDALRNITLFQNLIYVCYAIMALGLGLAIFFFFYFKIPEVFMLMTGRAKKETIQRIAEENFKTGKLRGPITGSTKHSGKLKKTGRTGSLAAVHISYTGPLTHTPPQPAVETLEQQAPGTNVLEQQAPETNVLNNEPETNVLSQSVEDTAVLSSEDGDTAILTAAPQQPTPQQAYGDTAILSQQDFGETSVLSQQMPKIRFDVTESTIVIHTDEKVG